jgi:hypothetical protein
MNWRTIWRSRSRRKEAVRRRGVGVVEKTSLLTSAPTRLSRALAVVVAVGRAGPPGRPVAAHRGQQRLGAPGGRALPEKDADERELPCRR